MRVNRAANYSLGHHRHLYDSKASSPQSPQSRHYGAIEWLLNPQSHVFTAIASMLMILTLEAPS